MSDILILARVRIHEFDLPVIADYYFDVNAKLMTVEGFKGLSVWRDVSDAESFLVIYDYASPESADEGLQAVTQARTIAESQTADFRPADVIRMHVDAQSQVRIHEADATTYLSMSVRFADPGYGPELANEIGMIFDELRIMPGFVGSAYGTSDSLEEEVIGLVTWESPEAFSASIPPTKRPNQVFLYSRFY